MKRVAFIIGPALGHASRTFMIANALAQDSASDIVLVSPEGDNHLEAVVGNRFPTVRIPCARNTDFAPGLEDFIGGHAFDLVAFDLNPLRWLREFRRPAVPCAYITNVFLTRAAGLTTSQVQRFRKRRPGRDGQRAAPPADTASAYDLYELDRVLLIDPVPLVERYAPLPASHKACGAVFWSADGELPPSLDDARDVLLISMGSTGRRPISAAMVNALVEAAGCACVVIAGTKVGDIEGVSVPVHAFSSIAIAPLLERCRLVVASGGTGSTYLALAGGVPVVVWPSHRNHEIMGEILEDMELGLLATEERNLGADLAASFPRMAAAAQAFAPAACSRTGAEAAAAELRSMLA